MSKQFWVVDLNPKGEMSLKEQYAYDVLQQIDMAGVLIAEFATYLWRDAEGFDVKLPKSPDMSMRWRPSADTAGIATLRCRGTLASVSLLASGVDRKSDSLTLQAFQNHLVRELHDTGFEPAFDLVHLPERPMIASVHFAPPDHPSDRTTFALADRCFAAAYFRYLGLA